MPMCFIEAPVGAGDEAKKKLVEKTSAALDATYHVGDVRVFVREHPAENVGQDGHIGAEPVRPVCFLEAPPLRSLDARRTLVGEITAAMAEAYDGLAATDEIMVFLNEYPLENVALSGRLQSDNPQIVEGLKQLNG